MEPQPPSPLFFFGLYLLGMVVSHLLWSFTNLLGITDFPGNKDGDEAGAYILFCILLWFVGLVGLSLYLALRLIQVLFAALTWALTLGGRTDALGRAARFFVELPLRASKQNEVFRADWQRMQRDYQAKRAAAQVEKETAEQDTLPRPAQAASPDSTTLPRVDPELGGAE